jgi:glucosamine--fructose-6-phosphate aminotransferase (isomerizing)
VEIGVAATKSFTVQLTAFLLFACALSGKNLPLDTLGDLCRRAAETEGEIAALAAKLSRAKGVFFLGRDLDYALSMEGSLKLKEISYLFSEGYAAGELKHGTLALVEKGVFVIALSTQGFLAKKTMNAVHEVSCRGAETAILTPFGNLLEESGADKVFLLPSAPPEMMPIVASVPLQLIAYHTALCRGYNPDRPRNLAKSVTVE